MEFYTNNNQRSFIIKTVKGERDAYTVQVLNLDTTLLREVVSIYSTKDAIKKAKEGVEHLQ